MSQQPAAPMNAMELMKQKQNASKLSPILNPGTYDLYLRQIELRQAPFGNKDENVTISLTWETEPVNVPEFKGLLKDPNNEHLGRFEGQIANTMIDRYYFSDFKTSAGKIIYQKDQLFRAMREFFVFYWGNEEAVPYDREKFASFRDYFDDVRDFLLDKNDVKARVTIGGSEYIKNNNGTNYTQYNLFLPRINKEEGTVSAAAYFAEGQTVMPVTEFDKEVHVIKVKSDEDKKAEKTTTNFGGGAPAAPGAPGAPASPGAVSAPAAPAAPGAPVAPGSPGSPVQA